MVILAVGRQNGDIATIVYGKNITLTFNTSESLQVWLKDVPNDIFENPEKYLVSTTIRQSTGTPYNQVKMLTFEIRKAAKQFVINAIGNGFVNGHLLTVSTIICKCK